MGDPVSELSIELRSVVQNEVNTRDSAGLFAGLAERFAACAAPRPVETSTRDVVDRWLEAAVEAVEPPWADLADKLLAATDRLPWLTTYENLEPSSGLEAFQPHYSFALLVGPNFRGREAPVRHDDLLAGFTLQAPGITYPAHHHSPPEIYGVMSGAVDWQVGETWTRRSNGDVIIHRPHESHSMRSLDEPVLSWAAWPRDPQSHVYMPSLDPPHERMPPTDY